MLLTQDTHFKNARIHTLHILILNIKIQSGYLDDLDAEGVVVWVAALVKGKTKRLLPVDRDTVEVLVR